MPNVTVIPGDGIGPEVIGAALEVIEALGIDISLDVLDHVNADRFRQVGISMSDDDFARIRASDAALLGAVGQPDLEHTDYVRSVLMRLRTDLDLYVNYRPVKLWHDRLSPLRDPSTRTIDCLVVRENTEGLYSGVGGIFRESSPLETAIDADINTYHGVSRVIDFSFSVARREVCMVDKANAVRSGGLLWQRCWKAASDEHPDIRTSHLYADAAAIRLVTDPTSFDVIVTNNSFGDILSDLAAAVAGGIGMAPSANLNAITGFGLFEPVHGTAPDIAGQDIANPFAAILAEALMIEHLGLVEEAAAIRRAVTSAIDGGRVTPDLGGSLGTGQVAAAVVAAL
jgi:3-isopropylmalate dehydrogenase